VEEVGIGGDKWRGVQSLAGLDEVTLGGSLGVSLTCLQWLVGWYGGGGVLLCWCIVVVKEEVLLLWYLGSWRWLSSLTGPATVPWCPFETFLYLEITLVLLSPIHSACRIDPIYHAAETFFCLWTPFRHLLPILVAVQPVVTMHHSDGDDQCQRGRGPILGVFL
jgi:hypothetical protein